MKKIYNYQSDLYLREGQRPVEAPLQWLSKPEDIAQAALFFASDASFYITGAENW